MFVGVLYLYFECCGGMFVDVGSYVLFIVE